MWLFDCGEGIQYQFFYMFYYFGKLNKIFIIYLYGDYLFGLFGLLCSCLMQGNFLFFIFYGLKGFKEFVEIVLCLSGLWIDYLFIIIEVGSGLVFDEEGYWVIVYLFSYLVECYGYCIVQYDKFGIFDVVQLIVDGVFFGLLFY